MIPELQGYALMYNTSHRLFHRALEGVTTEQARARTGDANPIQWIAAHVVAVRSSFLRGLGGRRIDFPWAKHFPRGAAVSDESLWPELSEVRSRWDEVHAAFMERLETLTSAELAAPTQIPGLDTTLLGALGLAALHDVYHVGQLGLARRIHGLGRIVG